MENPDTADIKSVTIEHSKTSRKLSKVIRQAEKVSEVSGTGKNFDSPLHSETKTVKMFGIKKNSKIAKWSHAFKVYASSYNVENLFNLNCNLKILNLQ